LQFLEQSTRVYLVIARVVAHHSWSFAFVVILDHLLVNRLENVVVSQNTAEIVAAKLVTEVKGQDVATLVRLKTDF